MLSTVLTVLFCFSTISLSQAFVSKHYSFESYIGPVLSGSYHHAGISRSAICRAQHDWLTSHTSANLSLPSPLSDDCPLLKWFEDGFPGSAAGDASNQAHQARRDIAEQAAKPGLDPALAFDPLYHFDADDRIHLSNQQLISTRNTMVSLANAGQYQGARQELGRALHALQSFYSHTNWLEQFGSVVNDKLGAQNDLGVSIASPATPTCRNCLKSELSATQLSQLNSFSAGLQEGSNTFWRPEFKADAVFSCSDNLIANSLLTTGYYSRDAIVSKPLNASKCSIGGGTDSSATSQATGGIGKDSASFLFSPHHELHSTAARVAHDASVAFLADVRKSVGDYNFGRLLGLAGQRVLGILMDTTGSMSSSITAAKAWAQQMVRNASASGDDTIYILTPFNDPAFGPYQQTTSAQQMLSWINPLSAGGGGDAPEKCFAALFLTLQQCPTQADLIVFTDAPTKDANLYPAIYALAVQKSARINFLVQGGHSLKMKLNNGTEVDREISKDSDIGNFDLYQALATATGGAYAVMGSGASEILNTTRIVDSAANMGVLVRQDKISGTAGGQWNFSVDGRLSSVEVVVSSVASLSTSRIHLIDPNGTESNHFLVSTATNVLLQANNPKQPGTWILRLDAGVSTSNVALLVRGASSISFTFSVTSPAENGRWPGLVPLSGKPLGGQTYFLTIDCDVCSTIESVQLRTCADNQLLATLPASQMEKAQIWFASALMPVTDAELCASFTGLDDLGLRYQRIARETVTPTQIKLEAQVINGTQSLFPMQTAVISFEVTNLGSSNSFTFQANDALNFVTDWSPKSATIAQNATVTGQISITGRGVPGQSSTIQVSASAAGSTLNTNFLSLTIMIIDPHPDVNPPICAILQTNQSACAAATDCNAALWVATVQYSDKDSGVGQVRQTSEDPSEITWSPFPSFNGTTNNINYTASAVGSCCLRHASLIVIDKVGLIGECDFEPPASSPCSGHGNVTCTCDFGYTGSNCESEIDFCSENVGGLQANTTLGSLCEPHGRCISTTAGAHCVCLPGFNGTVCELNVDNSTYTSHRCIYDRTLLNYGCNDTNTVCVPDDPGCGYYPTCSNRLGWCLPLSGHVEFDEAASTGGLCSNHGTASCQCDSGYSGSQCESDFFEGYRCALYKTAAIADDIEIGCKSDEYRCVPDNLDCALKQCNNPIGWCIPVGNTCSDSLKTRDEL